MLPSVHRAPFVRNSRVARPRALRAVPCCVPTLLVPLISPPAANATRFGACWEDREGEPQGAHRWPPKRRPKTDKATSTSCTGGGRGGRGRGRGRGRGGGEDMMDDQMCVAEFPHIHPPTPNFDQTKKLPSTFPLPSHWTSHHPAKMRCIGCGRTRERSRLRTPNPGKFAGGMVFHPTPGEGEEGEAEAGGEEGAFLSMAPTPSTSPDTRRASLRGTWMNSCCKNLPLDIPGLEVLASVHRATLCAPATGQRQRHLWV